MKVYVVLERGWSSGQLILWITRDINDAERLTNLNKEYRHWEMFELR